MHVHSLRWQIEVDCCKFEEEKKCENVPYYSWFPSGVECSYMRQLLFSWNTWSMYDYKYLPYILNHKFEKKDKYLVTTQRYKYKIICIRLEGKSHDISLFR